MICCEAFNLLVMKNVFIKIGRAETAKWIFAEANSVVDVDHAWPCIPLNICPFVLPSWRINSRIWNWKYRFPENWETETRNWKYRIFDLLPDCYIMFCVCAFTSIAIEIYSNGPVSIVACMWTLSPITTLFLKSHRKISLLPVFQRVTSQCSAGATDTSQKALERVLGDFNDWLGHQWSSFEDKT